MVVIVKCKRCKRERKHAALGLCDSCYITTRRKNNPKYNESVKKANKKWQKKNLQYWRDYYKNHKDKYNNNKKKAK